MGGALYGQALAGPHLQDILMTFRCETLLPAGS
jgi:hypothetical protein